MDTKEYTLQNLKPNLRPKTIEECWATIDKLIAIIQKLEERLNINSKNSSQPPSMDFRKKKKDKNNNNKKSSGRKPGGQPGHAGVSRKLVPVEQVNKIVTCLAPEKCEECGDTLSPLEQIVRHQVYEIPIPKYEITEYQILQAHCENCQKTYAGSTPKEVGRRGFGLRVHALIGLLTSKFRLSKRQALLLLKDFYNMPICVGSVSNVEHRVSQAIEPIHVQIKTSIDNSKIVHIDETGFKQNNRTGWAWLIATNMLSFFHLDFSRGKKIAKQLIGNFINRIIVSDRYTAYDYIPELNHQNCWAHLKRDFQKISERKGIAGVIGRRLLKHYGRLFAFWKASLKIGSTNERRSKKRRRYLQNALIKSLVAGAKCSHLTTARTCQNILKQGKSLWLFLDNKEIPATNNLAERQLRPLVIAKKFSFGVKSERGARFIERIYSLTLSCQQQKKNALTLLQDSIFNYFSGVTPPIFA